MGNPQREAVAPRRRLSRARARKLFAGLLCSAVLAGPFTPAGRAAPSQLPPCEIPGQITPHIPEALLQKIMAELPPETAIPAWYSVRMPRFSLGPQLALDYAVEPLAPQRLYVTNGVVVMRSSDSGCHWEESYSLASGTEFSEPDSRILEIEVSAPATVYLPIQQDEPVPRPHVVMTTDAGASWKTVDGALLNSVVGTITDFDASLGNKSAAALLMNVEYSEAGAVSLEGDQILFTTSTAGSVWEPRHQIENGLVVNTPVSSITLNSREELQHVEMNPVRPNEIWVYGDGGVFVSDGTNLNPVNVGRMRVMDVSLDGLGVVGYERDRPAAQLSVDGGGSFFEFDMPVPVESAEVIALSPIPEAVVSSYGKVFRQQLIPGLPNPILFDISPLDGRPVQDVQVGVKTSLAEDPFIFGRTADTIEVAYRAVGEKVSVPALSNLVARDIGIKDKYLEPASKRVVMRPRQKRTIPYTLGLPAAITPLDVYFMIDISGSMQNTINGIREAMQDIVDKLSQQEIDVHFGVGAFRAFNDPPAYDRVRDIGLPGQEVADALNSLRAGGGGAETQMAALKASVTGEAIGSIPPDLDMHFRPGSLRVAIEVTDEQISQGGGHPPYPEVIEALVAHDVKQVGLAIQEPPLLGEPNYQNPGEPAGTLQKVATGSKAIAPEGGVDCDGDGDIEIEAGGPLVCLIAPSRADEAALMADAIVNVLQAIQDVRDLDVSVTPVAGVAGPSRALESVYPTIFPRVDLKEESQHEFDVTVRCPPVTRKTSYPLSVRVLRGDGTLGSASLTVVCKPRPGEAPTPVLPVFAPLAAVLPPLPRPPDPIPEPNPNPQPNPQQNPQAGFAAQEQQQPQVALAQQEGPALPVEEENASDEYFATARHQESDVPPLAFIFAAAGVTSAYAFAALARQRTRTAHAGNRRRRRR